MLDFSSVTFLESEKRRDEKQKIPASTKRCWMVRFVAPDPAADEVVRGLAANRVVAAANRRRVAMEVAPAHCDRSRWEEAVPPRSEAAAPGANDPAPDLALDKRDENPSPVRSLISPWMVTTTGSSLYKSSYKFIYSWSREHYLRNQSTQNLFLYHRYIHF